MGELRRVPVAMAAGVMVSALVGVPVRAAPGPTTLAVEGTVRVVAVDDFGADATERYRSSVVTDDGTSIPVDLGDEVPANGRFSGELVVDGAVETALRDDDLLPTDGSTIDQASRAGQVAVAAATRQELPLTVVDSTVTPVRRSAAVTPAAHRTYVAVLDNRGSVEESDAQVRSIVDGITGYWTTEASGAITSFAIQDLRHFSSVLAGPTSTSCGMAGDPSAVWAEAALLWPTVSFSPSSRNHLVVAMADECSGSGVAGVADVGNDLSSGGRLSISLGSIAQQVGVHELGHTFGLGHANLATCPDPGICEYYDVYSPMGIAIPGPFGPPALGTLYRARLGVLVPGETATVTDPGVRQTFTLSPRSGSTGLRGLRVTDPMTGATYAVDWRTRTARDASTFYGSPWSYPAPVPSYPAGIVVEQVGQDGESYLVTRSVGGRQTGSFVAGSTFAPSAGLAVTVDAIGAAATVTVATGSASSPLPPPPAPAPPTVASTPAGLVGSVPRISGTPKVGRTLRVKVGVWTPRPSFRYQWYANGRRIASRGTGSLLRLTAQQKGKRITVRVTGTAAGSRPVVVTSRPTAKVARR